MSRPSELRADGCCAPAEAKAAWRPTSNDDDRPTPLRRPFLVIYLVIPTTAAGCRERLSGLSVGRPELTWPLIGHKSARRARQPAVCARHDLQTSDRPLRLRLPVTDGTGQS